MRRTCILASLSAVLIACSPKPVSTGPHYAFLALERWHRSDPAKEITMVGFSTFHRDERLPRATRVDEHCIIGSGNWGSTTLRPPSFGTITMKIADRKQVTWTETPEGVFYEPSAREWDTGDRLDVTAAGAEAPGFHVEAVVPAQVMLTSHDLAAAKADTLRVSRSAPLELTWSSGAGDVFLLLLQLTRSDGRRLRGAWCTWPAAAGRVTVPQAVLQSLEPSTADLATNIYFGGGGRQQVELDGLQLDVFVFKNEVARIQID